MRCTGSTVVPSRGSAGCFPRPYRGRGRGPAGVPVCPSRTSERRSPARPGSVARHDRPQRGRRCCTRMNAPVAAPTEAADRATPSVASEAIQRAELAVIWKEIAQLPRAQRDALLLREIRGLSYCQLADDLALSGPSVRSLLNRARQRLRVRLEHIRTTLGAVSGIEALGRIFAGGANPAVPVAAKAVALGFGAVAVTGGAAITPGMLEHHTARAPAARAAQPSPLRAAVWRSVPGAAASLRVPVARGEESVVSAR